MPKKIVSFSCLQCRRKHPIISQSKNSVKIQCSKRTQQYITIATNQKFLNYESEDEEEVDTEFETVITEPPKCQDCQVSAPLPPSIEERWESIKRRTLAYNETMKKMKIEQEEIKQITSILVAEEKIRKDPLLSKFKITIEPYQHVPTQKEKG